MYSSSLQLLKPIYLIRISVIINNKTSLFLRNVVIKTKKPKPKMLTSRVPAEDKFSNLIIYKDEKTIGKSTKPPARPVGKTRKQK